MSTPIARTTCPGSHAAFMRAVEAGATTQSTTTRCRWSFIFDIWLTRLKPPERVMIAAAVDPAGMEAIVQRFAARGLTVRILEEMQMGLAKREPAAWVLVCDRRSMR